MGNLEIKRTRLFHRRKVFRSFEYKDFLKTQKQGVRYLEMISKEYPVLYPLPEQFMFNYAMGYVDNNYSRKNRFSLLSLPSLEKAKNEGYLDECYFIYTLYPWLGSAYGYKMVERASRTNGWKVSIQKQFQNGPFKSYVYKIRKENVSCSFKEP